MGHKDYAEEHDKKRPNIVQEILGFLLYVAMVVGITFFYHHIYRTENLCKRQFDGEYAAVVRTYLNHLIFLYEF